MNRGRGEKKVADVHVREIGKVDPTDVDNLKPMFRSSGFVTPQLWKQAIEADMDEKMLFIELIQALEGGDVQRERALALVYELRDRSGVFDD